MDLMQASTRSIEWFQDSRFGMFIHWGLYSTLAKGEWVMHFDRIEPAEYEKLVPRFNPVKFSAAEWVALAADAGQKYIVITSRHHDGFCMYDSRLTEYKVTNTPWKRDPLAELAEACRKNGQVRLGFYVSLLDWHHPAYRYRRESGLAWADYIGFLHGHVAELCANYGGLACLWFDGEWPGNPIYQEFPHFAPGGGFEYEKLYAMIHRAQPDALVINNRHVAPLPGEDVQPFEQDLPGSNTSGWNTGEISGLPLETCLTINDSWGWSAGDGNLKTTNHLVRTLARAASSGANLLLNVGPTPEGLIHPAQAERLRGIGAWLNKNGESIYGTRKGGFPPTSRTVSTRRGDTHYLHDLNQESAWLRVKGGPQDISRAEMLDGTPVRLARKGEELVLEIPADRRDSCDTVIKLS
jgi:alpha-L-fucosidase